MAFKECQSERDLEKSFVVRLNRDRFKLLGYWPKNKERKVSGLRDTGVKHQGRKKSSKEHSSWTNRWSDHSSMKTFRQENA